MKKSTADEACPCGSGNAYSVCCKPLHDGEPAGSAQALMRSRYCAYARELHDYIHRSWHASTRPPRAEIGGGTHWLGLQIKRHEIIDETHAVVEFVARYKVNGRAFRLHETSRFVRENGHWFYIDGDIADAG